MNKCNKSDMDYIFRRLKDMSICEISDKYTKEIDSVSTPLVKEILQKRFTNGSDMKAALCLFDTLLLSSQVKRESGIYHLPTTVQKWVKKMEQIKVKSSEAKVYVSDILSGDIQVIIKTPKTKLDYDDLIREYFIGVTQINKLRYSVPNFVYTLGAFLYPEKKKIRAFVLYEKIPGETLEYMIKNDKITFEQYLSLFFQILIALEVAQRTIRFCHYDLHTGNILIRPITKPFTYTIVLNDTKYEITARDYIPVLIDFGMSSVTNEESKTIGSYHFAKHGMMPYLIQGADMYKLLFYSSLHSATKNFHRQILDLFIFYGKADPYQVLIQQPDFLKKISKEYAKKVAFSKIATYTPLEFAKWILSKEEYMNMLSTSVKVLERDIFFPLNYASTIQEYSDIFNKVAKGREDAINLALSCTQDNSPNSYILMEYTRGLLSLYDSDLKSESIGKQLKSISLSLSKNKQELFQQDKKLLNGYKILEIPDKIKLHEHINKILNTSITHKKDIVRFADSEFHRNDIKGLVNRFLELISFYTEMSYYFQSLYTIRELHLNERYDIYKTFVNQFTTSSQYKFYQETNSLVEKTIRWSITLLESVC